MDLCKSFVASMRTLSLYSPEHSETKKRVENIYKKLTVFLKQKPHITILILNSELVIETLPLPELEKPLSQFIQLMEDMKIQRFVFKNGLTLNELFIFLQFLVKLRKKPKNALAVLSENQKKFLNIFAGGLSADNSPKISYDEVSGSLQAARKSVFSVSEQLKNLFEEIKGPLTGLQLALAKKITRTIYNMNINGEIPLKVLIYRLSSDNNLYMHAINVCVLSMALGRDLGLEDSIVEEVGLGALLHDIGLQVLQSRPVVLNSTGELETRQSWWGHPQRGAELLLATPDIPDLVPLVAYEHHIHYDGGGYPKREKSRNLTLASLITCITDSYDNLRRDTQDKKALTLTQAINWMDGKFGTQFNPILLKKFRAMIKAQVDEDI